MSSTLRSFSSPAFRLWFIGALVSNIGTWMQTTALSWVILTELSSGDAQAMGVAMALQFAPQVLLAGLAGRLADRVERRRILIVTQCALLSISVTLGILLLLQLANLGIVFAFAFLLGLTSAIDTPARQMLVVDLVVRAMASNAIALNAAAYNGARMIGPGAAGLMLALTASGWVFIANGCTFLAMLAILLVIRPVASDGLACHRMTHSPDPRRGSGIRHVLGRPDLIVALTIAFLVGTFAMNLPILASTMALEFEVGAEGFGALTSILAIGSVTGAVVSARAEVPRLRTAVFASLGIAIAIGASGLMPAYPLYAMTLPLCGLASVILFTTVNGYVQTTAEPALRGQVLAVYIAVVLCAAPIGAPALGWVAVEVGARTATLCAAGAALTAFVLGGIWLVSARRGRSGPATPPL